MGTIYNKDVFDELRYNGKIQNTDTINNQISGNIVPVMEVNPRLVRPCNVSIHNASSTTGNTVIYTVPSGKDFFCTGVYLTYASDAACDGTGSSITFVDQYGATRRMIGVFKIASTAYSQSISLSFPTPILIRSGVAINLSNNFTAGVSCTQGGVHGYTVDNPIQ